MYIIIESVDVEARREMRVDRNGTKTRPPSGDFRVWHSRCFCLLSVNRPPAETIASTRLGCTGLAVTSLCEE